MANEPMKMTTRSVISHPRRRLARSLPFSLSLLAALGGVTFVGACSSDDTLVAPRFDAGTADAARDTSTPTDASQDADATPGDAGQDADATPGDAGQDADAGPGDAGQDADASQPPVFLDPSAYASLLTIDARFPYGVTAKHAADLKILGSRWGRHGGPSLTKAAGDAGGRATVVARWSLPASATDPATKQEVPFVTASDLPAQFFYGADGMIDLPFGPYALNSYTTGAAAFPGEALLYSGNYDTVRSRAKVNGFYSGVGLAEGERQRIVYSGLSPFSATASATNDNGLYAADVCNGELTAPAPCPAPQKLYGWTGSSGPVVADAHGNVFTAALVQRDAGSSDAIYGIAKTQAFANGPQTQAAIADVGSSGTSSLAAVPPQAAREGWVLGIGYDADSKLYAASFTEASNAVARGAVFIDAAIVRTNAVQGISMFSDQEGDLWLAVVTANEGWFLQLQRKP